MSIKNALDDEIRNELENLKKEAIGSDVYKANIDGVTKLLDRKIEIEKLENERLNKIDSMETEIALRERQLKEDRKSRISNSSIKIGTFVCSTMLYTLAFIASTNFERYGSFTTKGGINSIGKLLTLKNAD